MTNRQVLQQMQVNGKWYVGPDFRGEYHWVSEKMITESDRWAVKRYLDEYQHLCETGQLTRYSSNLTATDMESRDVTDISTFIE